MSFIIYSVNGYSTQNISYVANDYFRAGSIVLINNLVSQFPRQ